jgi:hypothetical protein
MRRFNGLIVLGLLLAAMPAVQAQQTGDLERIATASQQFVAAIGVHASASKSAQIRCG